MTQIQTKKNSLIDRILMTNNEKLLSQIEDFFISNYDENKIVSLSSEQIEMLLMSENDIKNGNIISQKQLDEIDHQWMK